MKPKAIIVDIDGTLANSSKRTIDAAIANDWDEFGKAIAHDKVNHWCLDMVKLYRNSGYKIIYVTGRSDRTINTTIKWLKRHGVFNPSRESLIMRKEGDYRKDDVIKNGIYHKVIAPHFDIQFVLEDRKRNVAMYRELGLTVLQCAWGEF